MEKKMKKQFKRHGDVILHPVKETRGEVVKHNGKFILALGEATGHSHQLICEKMVVKRDMGRNFIEVSDASLTHQEHKLLKLNEKFAQVQEREVDHFLGAVRKVVD